MEYDRELIPEGRRDRLKEWDFYSVSSPDFHMELTLADISWAVLVTVSFIDYRAAQNGTNIFLNSQSELLDLPADPYEDASFERNQLRVSCTHEGKVRTLRFDFPELFVLFPHIRGEILIQDDPTEDSLVTAYPFDPQDLFFYTDKMVALPASGYVEVDGKEHLFSSEDSYAVLDWGRGVWPEEFEWGWAIAAGMANGKRVGFNIGFGEEDNSRGSGNSVVYDGVLHKLGEIEWTYNEDDIMQPWHFQSADNRFDVVLEPNYDVSTKINLIIYSTNTIKVHGRASGYVVLDNGKVVDIENLQGFAEHCYQKW
jgi:hypothetical protein